MCRTMQLGDKVYAFFMDGNYARRCFIGTFAGYTCVQYGSPKRIDGAVIRSGKMVMTFDRKEVMSFKKVPLRSYDVDACIAHATRRRADHHVYHRYTGSPRGCKHEKYPCGCRNIIHVCSCGEFCVETTCGNDAVGTVLLQRFVAHFPAGSRPLEPLYKYPLENEY